MKYQPLTFFDFIKSSLKGDIHKYNEAAFRHFPVNSIVYFKREKIFGKVTAHGFSLAYNHTPLLGIKVPGLLGSAMLYNREAFASELIHITLTSGVN